jgi:hypothetical protein
VLIAGREFDGRAYVLQAMHSTDGGTTWSAPQRLAESSGATDYPLPLTDGKRALVVWNSEAEACASCRLNGARQNDSAPHAWDDGGTPYRNDDLGGRAAPVHRG